MNAVESLDTLANRFGSDKGTAINCAHGFTRVYEALLRPCRESPLRIVEIGLMHGRTQLEFRGREVEAGCASLRMWAEYLPKAEIHGLDIIDFTALATDRIRIHRGDQGSRSDLEEFSRNLGGAPDLIVDDGSHASHHQQIALASLFPRLASGGLYVIEDLHFQPAELELPGVTPTRLLLRQLLHGLPGAQTPLSQPELGYLLSHIQDIAFFDSLSPLWPLGRTEDALAVIVKKGQHPVLKGIPR